MADSFVLDAAFKVLGQTQVFEAAAKMFEVNSNRFETASDSFEAPSSVFVAGLIVYE